MHNARSSADPVNLGAQSDLICVPRLVAVDQPSAARNGGTARRALDEFRSRDVVRRDHGVRARAMTKCSLLLWPEDRCGPAARATGSSSFRTWAGAISPA
jgi:hypothetical protein